MAGTNLLTAEHIATLVDDSGRLPLHRVLPHVLGATQARKSLEPVLGHLVPLLSEPHAMRVNGKQAHNVHDFRIVRDSASE